MRKKPLIQGTFWSKLPKPFFVMAPMANVTDSVFRKLFAKYGKPDVTWTEFVSADGLVSAGRERLLVDFRFSPEERPIVAQLFTGHPEAMRQAAALVAKLGFDGLDVNMGCPDRAVVRQGGGAALMNDPKMAIEVLEAARIGIREILNPKSEILDKSEIRNPKFKSQKTSGPSLSRSGKDIPVSIKTRIGYNSIDLDWIRLLLGQRLPALTIHLRTRKEMSEVPSHWELMPKIIAMRDEIQSDLKPGERTLVIGNGDAASLEDAAFKCKKYGCDGAMIGRGIFGKPWFFENANRLRIDSAKLMSLKGNALKGLVSRRKGTYFASLCKSDENFVTFQKPSNRHILAGRYELNIGIGSGRTPEERLKIMVEHAKLFEKEFGAKKSAKRQNGRKAKVRHAVKSFAVMRKHFKAYVSGWDGAKELRAELMEAEDYKEVKMVVDKYLAYKDGWD